MRKRARGGERGFGLVEILLVAALVAVVGFVLVRYARSTATTVQTLQETRPLAQARLAADQATLVSVQGLVRAYHAQHGRWPADKAAVLTLLAGPPRWQCAGNDLDYDAASGTISLAISAAERC